MADLVPDKMLLRRFSETRDEQAFSELVERHAALIWGVVLRMMRQRQDAEDAFQATFMVLARRAKSLGDVQSVAAWLHGVAARICRNHQKSERRRVQRLQEAADLIDRENDAQERDSLRALIDHELSSLPQRYREVLIMCDIEGFRHEEVAQQLAVPVGTVWSRLSRGRKELKRRLVRQGIVVSAGGASLLALFAAAASASPPAGLLETTVRHADTFVWGTAAAKSTMNLQITRFAQGALRAMMISRYKTIVCFIAIVAASMFGGAMLPNGFSMLMTQSAAAKTIVFDDFNDGNSTDGNPSTWRPYTESGLVNGDFDASSGDLVLRPNPDEILVALLSPPIDQRNVSMRAQVRLTGTPQNPFDEGIGLLARGIDEQSGSGRCYQGGIDLTGTVFIGDNSPQFHFLAQKQTDLRPGSEDVVLQFDLVDDSLMLFAWRAGDAKPATPLVEVTSTMYSAGNVGLLYDPPTGNGTATIRYVHVADKPIVPEPSGGMLCVIGSGVLGIGLLVQRRCRA